MFLRGTRPPRAFGILFAGHISRPHYVGSSVRAYRHFITPTQKPEWNGPRSTKYIHTTSKTSNENPSENDREKSKVLAKRDEQGPSKGQTTTTGQTDSILQQISRKTEAERGNLSIATPYTIPNMLTATRIATAPFVGYFIVSNEPNIALALFVYSCATDFVDGYIARKYNMKSVLGSILDPTADKLLMGVCTLSLTYTGAIPGLVAAAIIGRDAMLSAMAFYYRFVSLEPPRAPKFLNLVRYPTISVHPNLLGKVNTAMQMVYIGGLVCRPWIEQVAELGLDGFFGGMGAVVGVTTVASGVSYLMERRFKRL